MDTHTWATYELQPWYSSAHLVPHCQYLLQNDAAGRVDIVIFPEHPVLVGLGRGAADDLVLARPAQVDIHTQLSGVVVTAC